MSKLANHVVTSRCTAYQHSRGSLYDIFQTFLHNFQNWTNFSTYKCPPFIQIFVLPMTYQHYAKLYKKITANTLWPFLFYFSHFHLQMNLFILALFFYTTLLLSYADTEVLTKKTDNQQEWAKQQNLDPSTSIKQFDHGNDTMNLQNRSTNYIFNAVDILGSNLTDAQIVNQIIASTLLITERHNGNSQRYLKALSNDLKEHFFLCCKYFYIQWHDTKCKKYFVNTLQSSDQNYRFKSLILQIWE